MTPAFGVKRYHSEVVRLQNVPRAIKSSPDNQEYLRGQRVYHCGDNYQLTPYSEPGTGVVPLRSDTRRETWLWKTLRVQTYC